ncbi:hypothetical protein QE152_g1477 [Popillia japonica]|uniref:Uncharacterized protein n=1 Tax=Popillia japonica TaxID=7064 RepID=A0AAW1N647_POPJA
MKGFLLIAGIVLVLLIGEVRLEIPGHQDCYETIGGGVCLDHNHTIIPCNRSNECAFIFHCPENFSADGAACYYQYGIETCPGISSLNYSLDFNRDYEILPRRSDDLIEEEGSGTGICSFNVKEFLAFGGTMPVFELQFDRVNGKMS